ncbi:TPA: hypothetical protein N0F65_006332 [Lagenidium giganteum]|uniref:Uncharacterized protein n=1 Tax=Lagenidium giganteum TaxID=4803 RepID=A0AAV2YL57_9STRA|nr:TPA: hypothetical protein N0F65_006332 [Lagenidium giganteum]
MAVEATHHFAVWNQAIGHQKMFGRGYRTFDS